MAENLAECGSAELSRSLRSRHVTMIAIGGIIGAGLFVGSSAAIAAVGPAIIVSYLLAGLVILLVMRMLSEMAAANPHIGSFTEFPRLALGPWAGFMAGWLYWYFWVVVVAIEAIAGAQLLNLWIPVPVWQIGLALMVLLTAVNLMSTRSYGEFEFWFASIKVAAIIVFIVIAGSSVLGLGPAPATGFGNLAAHGGFAPFGPVAVLAGITSVIFSLCGAEIATIAAAESNESARTISRLTITIILRIVLFYVLSILLIVAIVPWREIQPGLSPFATALDRIGIPYAATMMNAIVLTAVLSCLNSGVYVTSRVLFTLAAQRRRAAVDGGAESQPRAGPRDSHRQLIRLCGRDRVDHFAIARVRVPGQCIGRHHADDLSHHRAGPDPPAPAPGARRSRAPHDPDVAFPLGELGRGARDPRRARRDGVHAGTREPALCEPRLSCRHLGGLRPAAAPQVIASRSRARIRWAASHRPVIEPDDLGVNRAIRAELQATEPRGANIHDATCRAWRELRAGRGSAQQPQPAVVAVGFLVHVAPDHHQRARVRGKPGQQSAPVAQAETSSQADSIASG